jgi:hypothetical protein
MIEETVRLGGVLKRDRFSKYVFSRSAFNRMDYAEQKKYEEKLKTKMPFAVELPSGSFFEITKTEADYFLSLGGSEDFKQNPARRKTYRIERAGEMYRAVEYTERGEYLHTICKAWSEDECVRLAEAQGYAPELKKNPDDGPGKKALDMYESFNGHEPLDVGEFKPSFFIPGVAVLAGPAVNVMYRSDKNDPSTGAPVRRAIDYIHEHDDGVNVYRCDSSFRGPGRSVPAYIANAKELVLLGDCLGFAYLDDTDTEIQADATGALPELYTIPSGRALLVVQGKSRVLALIWGGDLGVEARGIVH